MEKKILKSIPVNKFDLGTTALSNIKLTYFINAYVRNKILILDIYDTNSALKYRIFQTKTEFITIEGNKWRESKLINLLTGYHYPTFVATKKAEQVIKKYLGTEDDALEALKSTQEDIRKAELDYRHKAELDLIDKYMKPVREVPKDFKRWLNDVALIRSRYIIYEYKAAQAMKGKCTHCQADVIVRKPKHNTPGTCPSCKSEIIYKAKGRANNIIDSCSAQLLQKHPSGVIVREFGATKKYIRDGGAELTYWERNRSITGKENIDFAWDTFKQTGKLNWCKDKYWYINTGALYTANLKKELSGTDFIYSGLPEMMQSGRLISATDYLRAYQKGPALEYLSKLKLHKLVINILDMSRYPQTDINLQGKSLKEVLRLNKENLNRAISIDVNCSELRLLQISERQAVSIPDELLREIARDYSSQLEDFVRISKLSTIHQLMKYIKKKNVRFSDYHDYISMAEKLNWNIADSFILFPRHFKVAHDQAQSLINVKASYQENRIIKKMYEDFNKQLSFSTEDYSIRLPMSAKEVIREGHKLHHCISNYIKRIISGKTLILFIRKRNDPYTPYYTLQLNPEDYKVIQVRGYDNIDPDASIRKLLDEYKKSLSKIHSQIAS